MLVAQKAQQLNPRVVLFDDLVADVGPVEARDELLGLVQREAFDDVGAGVVDGFKVTGFGAALVGSLIYSLCGMVIDVAMERLFSRSDA